VLGQKPVQFKACCAKTADLAAASAAQAASQASTSAAAPSQEYMWDPQNGYDQWWIDALTVDPSQMLENMSGLWVHGEPQPVTSTKLGNASIGSLPKVMVYLVCHAKFGTHAFFPYHGAKHGGDAKDGEGKMYDGFQYWYSELTPEQREQLKGSSLGNHELTAEEKKQIIQLAYCNQQPGIKAFKTLASEAEQEKMKTGPFNPNYFMVCTIVHDDQLYQLAVYVSTACSQFQVLHSPAHPASCHNPA